MGISLDQNRAPLPPVLKRRTIGERFVGAIIRTDQRQVIKDNKPQFHESGKPRMELVVTLITKEGGMTAGLRGDDQATAPGDHVRLILKGGGFAQWIEATGNLRTTVGRGVEVGDVVMVNTTHAIRYSGDGTGTQRGRLDTQDQVDAYYADQGRSRSETLGFRGEVAIRAAKPEEGALVAQCEEAYHATEREHITLDNTPTPAPVGVGAADDGDDF